MSDYQRFVSYLYEYQKNQKSASRGFARVEVRNRQCRIEIHMKLSQLPFTPLFQVCTFVPKEDGLLGIPLGRATYQRGNVRASFILSPEKLKESDISFDHLGGLIIQSDLGQTYASVWKDITIQPEQLYFPEDKDSLRAASTTPAQNQSNAFGQSQTDTFSQSQTNTTSQTYDDTRSQTQIGAVSQTHGGASSQSRANTTLPPLTDASSNTQTNPSPRMQENAARQPQTDTFTQSPSAAAPDTGNPWNWLQNTYPHVHPFFDDELQECVKVTLRDIPELTAHGFRIGANTFLNHSCQSFHHFLIGKMEDQQETLYILAAPGLFDENERLLAGLFHFPNFKPSRSALTRPGVFGYWYRTLN